MTDTSLAPADLAPTGESHDPDWQAWAEFSAVLRTSALTTSTLARWIARPVSIGSLERQTRAPGSTADCMEGRRITLVASIDGRVRTLCEATARVRLDPLPRWARRVLSTTSQPLGRTLYRAGAERRWQEAELAPVDRYPGLASEASAEDRRALGSSPRARRSAVAGPGLCLVVRASFTLPGHGDVATVQEAFSPIVADLRTSGFDPCGQTRDADRLIDDTDAELLRVLRRRRNLARPVRPIDGTAPPAYPVHNELLRHQLVEEFGRELGGQLYTAITRPVTAPVVAQLPEPPHRQSRLA